MAEFPEWNAGEIVEDDVGDFLDARSARAAKFPVKPRRQGRVPPKKSANSAASPRAMVAVLPAVECLSVEDDLAMEGLMGSPPPLKLDGGRGGRSAGPARSRAALVPEPPTEPLRRQASRLLRTINAAHASTNVAAPKQPSARKASVPAPSRTDTPPPTAPPPKQLMPASSKRIVGTVSLGESVSSVDNDQTSDCESVSVSKSTAARPLLPGYNLPIICRTNVTGEGSEARKSSTPDVPAPRRANSVARGPTAARDPGSHRSTLCEDDMPGTLAGDAVPVSPTSRTKNPRATVREPPTTPPRSRGASFAVKLAGPSFGDSVRRSRASLHTTSPKSRNGQRSSHPSFVRHNSQRRSSMESRGDLKKSFCEYSFGELLERTATEHSRVSVVAASTHPAAVNSVASSANYSALRSAFEASVSALDKSNGTFALPRMESNATKLHVELRGSNSRGAAAANPRPSSRAPADNGLASTRNRSFYSTRSLSRPPVAGPATTTKPAVTAPVPATRTGGSRTAAQRSEANGIDKRSRRGSQSKLALRRRSAEFGEV